MKTINKEILSILLSPQAAADYLSISKSTLYKLSREGALPRPAQLSKRRSAYHIDDLKAFADKFRNGGIQA